MSPISLAARIVGILRQQPGLSDRELTDLINGQGALQQPIHRACLRLAADGLIARRRRADGTTGNYAIGAGARAGALGAEDPAPAAGAGAEIAARTGGVVYFSHGRESGPWGSKIRRLAREAEAQGFAVESLDYTGIADPDERAAKLAASGAAGTERLILAGSSMGGYVATIASRALKPQGLFLMAPAFYMPGYADQDPSPDSPHVAVVHGWNDAVVPVEHSIRFARVHRAQLHLVDGDHRLLEQLDWIAALFRVFLSRCA